MKSIEKLCENIKKSAREIVRDPVAFLREGAALGNILCVVLISLFLAESAVREVLLNASGILVFIVTAFLVFLGCEIATLLIRLLLGIGKTGRIYFYVAFIALTAINLLATGGNDKLIIIVMSLLAALSTDIFGRCVLAVIRRRGKKCLFGYIALSVSLAYLIFYGYICCTDNLGRDRVALYMNRVPNSTEEVRDGFREYLEDGNEEIATLTYGPGEEYDIRTDYVDMSNIVERKGFVEKLMDITRRKSFAETPVSGIVYYPRNTYNCPTLFMVHGAHTADVPSYLGYDYLGKYLASNGYVVVSVDENIINEMSESNDIRAILLLENMKCILAENNLQDSLMFGRIDEDRIALGGHSRGGEMVATAYLFNDLATYPENGNIEFDYHYNISSIVAIAPTVDQYTPSDHSVIIEDVDYLLLHGANDQDVHSMMGEKQYNNVIFSQADEGDRVYTKASVYIYGANHGQFNSQWGRYDMPKGLRAFLNTAHLLSEQEQQLIARAYIRTFLDMSLNGDNTYSDLLMDCSGYRKDLPQTVYITNYKNSHAIEICSFEDLLELNSLDEDGVSIRCEDMAEWKIGSSVYGNGKDEENYVLQSEWKANSNPRITVDFEAVNLDREYIAFRIKDMMGGNKNRTSGVDYSIELTDVLGHSVTIEEPTHIYPKIGIQLYKQDVLSGSYEYKHQFQTVIISRELFGEKADFDFGNVVQMNIVLNGSKRGRVYLDDIFTAER